MKQPICRFEDRIQGTALALETPVDCLKVTTAKQLPAVLQKISAYQQQGYWIALLLDYELGYWLEPALASNDMPLSDDSPRLVAHVFRHARHTSPWKPDSDNTAEISTLTPEISPPQHAEAISRIHQLIQAGEVYQINYTFNINVEIKGNPQSLYRRISNTHPSAYAAYIEDAQRTVLCFSPELFIQRRGNTLTCKPMKGTAPRFTDPQSDKESARNLQYCEKNRAENLMIVDLMRHDLHQISATCSVKVPNLFTLEAYPSVWTLTSTITSELAENASLYKIIKALFPCGSITGAPKIAAMRYIQQLEQRRRGLYCGSIGWLAPNGDFSFNIAIRTLVLNQQGQGYYAVGGGIVHDSVAEQEWQECFWKARLLQS